ncbi:MAG: hypothetical protein WA672_06250, partial [Candidatus Angelobacter sp.]
AFLNRQKKDVLHCNLVTLFLTDRNHTLRRLGRSEKKQKVLPAYSRADEYARSPTAVRMTNF